MPRGGGSYLGSFPTFFERTAGLQLYTKYLFLFLSILLRGETSENRMAGEVPGYQPSTVAKGMVMFGGSTDRLRCYVA